VADVVQRGNNVEAALADAIDRTLASPDMQNAAQRIPSDCAN
jgi:hypothetical protein